MAKDPSAQTVVCEGHTVNVQRGPFGNKFTVLKAEIIPRQNYDELKMQVLCTEDSSEPGRIYAAAYSPDGEILYCNTLN